jgi:hypothetical protein
MKTKLNIGSFARILLGVKLSPMLVWVIVLIGTVGGVSEAAAQTDTRAVVGYYYYTLNGASIFSKNRYIFTRNAGTDIPNTQYFIIDGKEYDKRNISLVSNNILPVRVLGGIATIEVSVGGKGNTIQHPYYIDFNELAVNRAMAAAPIGSLRVTPSRNPSEQTKVQWNVQ